MCIKKEKIMLRTSLAVLVLFFGILSGGIIHASPVYIDSAGFGGEGYFDSALLAEAGHCAGDLFHNFAENAIDTGEIDIVFCIDTTGSMYEENPVIKARNILMEFYSNGYDVNFGIVTFGDVFSLTDFDGGESGAQLGDEMIDFNYRTSSIGFDGFGVAAERNVQLDAIMSSLYGYEWRPNSIRIIYLITNSPYHQRGDGSGVSSFLDDEVYSAILTSGTVVYTQFNTTDAPAASYYNDLSGDSGGESYPLSSSATYAYEDIASLVEINPVIRIYTQNNTSIASPIYMQLIPRDHSCMSVISPNPISSATIEVGSYAEGSWSYSIDSLCSDIDFDIRIWNDEADEMYRYMLSADGLASEPCLIWNPIMEPCIEYGSELSIGLYGYFPDDPEDFDYATITIDGTECIDDCRALTSTDGTNIVLPDLTPDSTYNVCIEFDDPTIIPGPFCHDFNICEVMDSTGDICPPVLIWETSSATCLHAWEDIVLHFLEIETIECTLQTGIDTSTLEITVNGYPVEAVRGGPPLPPGPINDVRYSISVIDIPPEFFMLPFTVRVAVRDMAGNYYVDSRNYSVCTIDIDSLPPVINWLVDEDSISTRDTIYAHVFDSLIIPYSGLALDSLIVLRRECGTVFPPIVWPGYSVEEFGSDSFMISIFAEDYFEDGCSEFCIQAYDHAGNLTENCIEIDFYNPPVDTFEPCISYASPAEGDTVGETGIELVICDNCPFSMPDWWVDPTSIELSLDGEDVPVFVYPADSEDSTCNGSRVLMDGEPILTEGVHQVCIEASDFLDNELITCYDFTLEYEDTSAPCIDWYGLRPPFYSDDIIDINAIALCGGIDHSRIDTSTLVISMGGCDDSLDILIEDRDYHLYGSTTDTLGISLRPSGGFEPGCMTVCVSVADFAGNSTFECIDIDVIDEGFDVTGFDEVNGKHISCEEYVIELPYTGVVPDSFELILDDTLVFDLSSYGLSATDEYIRFSPTFGEHWVYSEGEHYIYTDYGSAVFTIDFSSPFISRSYPMAGDTVDASNDSVFFYVNDLYSDIAIDGDSIRILLDGELITHGDYGLRYIWSESKVIMDSIPEGFFTPGNAVEIWFHVADVIDECAPNFIDTNWTFYIAPEEEDTVEHHFATISISDTFGNPLLDQTVHVYDYYSYNYTNPVMEVEGVDSIVVLDLDPGIYSIAVMDPANEYSTRFYNNKSNPLEAIPLVISDSLLVDSVEIDISLTEIDPATYFSVRGRVADIVDDGLDGCYVIAISSDEVEEDFSLSGRTGDDGIFDLRVPDGEYIIFAYSGGYIPTFHGDSLSMWVYADTLIVDGVDVSDIELTIREATEPDTTDENTGEIAVDVFDADSDQAVLCESEALPAVRLYLYDDDDSDLYVTITNHLGRGVFHDIPSGSYTVIADKIGYEMSTDSILSIDVPAGELVNVTVNMIYYDPHGVEENPNPSLPEYFEMSIAPNPFNSTTRVSFNLIEKGDISLNLISVRGRVIRTYELGILTPGMYSQILNPSDLPSGIYLLGIDSDGENLSYQKLLLVK